MIPVALQLKNKKVLVIGGGKVALRKIKQFLKEEAKVYVITIEAIEEIKQLDIHIMNKEYEKTDLQDYFLVYAATDCQDTNHSIVLDCQQMNILCGSATYEEDVGFYSMGYLEHDKGMVALSMNQKLPYHKPLLHEMIDVLDKNNDRLDILFALREAVLKYSDNKRAYFKRLFEIDIKVLEFINDAYKQNKGYLFIYHQSEYQEDFHFHVEPYLCLSITEYEKYHDILNIYPYIKVIPLVLVDGMILKRIQKLAYPLYCHGAILKKEEDIKNLINILESDYHKVYFIHPRQNKAFKDNLNKLLNNEDLYELDEQLNLDKNETYQFIPLLLTHGQHYHDIEKKIDDLRNKGFKIYFEGCLLDQKEIIQFIEKEL